MLHLRELRQEKNLTQADLSKILKISASAIGMYEQGRREPDHDTLSKMADFFQVSTDYLLGQTPYRTRYIGGLLGKSEDFVPLEDGDAVLQQSPKCRVLVHTTKGLPDEAIDDLIAIAEVYKKKYGIK